MSTTASLERLPRSPWSKTCSMMVSYAPDRTASYIGPPGTTAHHFLPYDWRLRPFQYRAVRLPCEVIYRVVK